MYFYCFVITFPAIIIIITSIIILIIIIEITQ